MAIVVRMPRVLTRSFTENGTPCSGPSVAPRLPSARSAARASRRACSAVRVTKALRIGFSASTRARIVLTTSTGETCLRLIIAASVVAGSQLSSSVRASRAIGLSWNDR